MFRDELPWLYEMGVEAYRRSLEGDDGAAKQALMNFYRGVQLVQTDASHRADLLRRWGKDASANLSDLHHLRFWSNYLDDKSS